MRFLTEALATGSEPLVRRNIGERALPGTAVGSGAMLWILSTLLSMVILFVVTSAFSNSGFLRFLSVVVPFLTGGAVFVHFCYCVRQNAKGIQEIRASKRPYHSMSKGTHKFDSPQLALRLTLAVVAGLILCPVVSIAYIASRIASNNLAERQQRDLLDKYYDRMDSEIQDQYLEDAILGNVPPEITDLYKALPKEGYDDEMRLDVARANVGKPVSIVAQRARSADEAKPAPVATPATEPPSPQPQTQSPSQPTAAPLPPETEIKQEPVQREIPSATGGKSWKLNVIMIASIVAATALAVLAFRGNTSRQETAAPLVHASANQSAAPPSPTAVAQITPHQTPAVKGGDLPNVGQQASTPLSPQVVTHQASAPPVQAVRTPDNNQLNVSNYSALLLTTRSNTIAVISTNKSEWTRRIEAARNEIATLGYFNRRKLQPRLEGCVGKFKLLLEQHRDFVAYVDGQFQLNLSRSQFSEAEYQKEINGLRQKADALAQVRSSFDQTLNQLRDDAVTKRTGIPPYDPYKK